jgi:SAM-dependent methyltransferase
VGSAGRMLYGAPMTEDTLDTPASFFEGLALELWNSVVPAELTSAEVAFLADRFRGISGRQTPRLLDVACGAGRHALGLARARFDVTGLDLVASELEVMVARAKANNVAVGSIERDMRDVGALADEEGFKAFDGAYIFGNALGYLTVDELVDFLEGMARVVRVGGRLILDTAMVAESLLHRLEEVVAIDGGEVKVVIENDYDIFGSRLVGTYTFEGRGQKVVKRFAHHVTTTRELLDALEGAGFEVEQALGDLDGADYEVRDPRLILVARHVEA